MNSKRHLNEGDSSSSSEEEGVPAKKRLFERSIPNLSSDLPSEYADDVSQERQPEMSERQAVTSSYSNQGQVGSSESKHVVDNYSDDGGDEESDEEIVEFIEDMDSSESYPELNLNEDPLEEAFDSDKSSERDLDSGDSTCDFVSNCESNLETAVSLDTSEETAKNVESNPRTFISEHSNTTDSNEGTYITEQSNTGDSNEDGVSAEPSQDTVSKLCSDNNIDAGIDSVVARCSTQSAEEVNNSAQEVIQISSDSSDETGNIRSSAKIANDSNKISTNRFLRIMAQNSSPVTLGGAGKTLVKAKIVGSTVSVAHVSVGSVQQSRSHVGSISTRPVIKLVVNPKVAQSAPAAFVQMNSSDNNAHTLLPQSLLLTAPVSQTEIESAKPVQRDNASNVVPSAKNTKPSSVQKLGSVQMVKSIPKVVNTSKTSGSDCMEFSEKDCFVSVLFKRKFLDDSWTDKQRASILEKGRPWPQLVFGNDDAQKHFLRISENYYKTIPWLAGSSKLNIWFCWPCLLFSSSGGVWTLNPQKFDKALFVSSADKHEITNHHLEAAIRMKTYEMKIKTSSNIPIVRPKETVRKNRHFLKLLIEVVCTVKKKRNNMYTSHTDCMELINLISCYDGDLKDYLLEKSQSSKSGPADLVSSHVGGVLASVETHIRSVMRSKLDDAPFVCLILEDASDVVDKSWISVIVRYVDENGVICERFVTFVELGYLRNPDTVVPVFKNIVTKLGCGSRLVGFTYGGTLVDPPQTASFNELIATEYPTARFFHYKEHNLRKLICQAISHLKYTRGFFQCISDLSDFFECTPNAVKELATIDNDVYPDRPAPEVWDFSSGFILTIKDHYASIVKLLMKIIAWPSDWTSEATVQAPYFLNFLRKVQNRFFIVLLAKIFGAVEALTKAMEENIDVDEWKLLAKRATLSLFQIKNSGFDEIAELAGSNSMTKESVSDVSGKSEICNAVYKATFNEMIDYVATVINSRNKGAESSFISADILNSISANEEDETKQQILDRLLANMKLNDFTKLKAQVKFFRSNKFFSCKSPSRAIQSINEFKLLDTMADLYKFLQLLITVPGISSDPLSEPIIKRVKMYTRQKIELNSVDALMWIEKNVIDKMQEDKQFYEKVLDIFVKQNNITDSMFSTQA